VSLSKPFSKHSGKWETAAAQPLLPIEHTDGELMGSRLSEGKAILGQGQPCNGAGGRPNEAAGQLSSIKSSQGYEIAQWGGDGSQKGVGTPDPGRGLYPERHHKGWSLPHQDGARREISNGEGWSRYGRRQGQKIAAAGRAPTPHQNTAQQHQQWDPFMPSLHGFPPLQKVFFF
jgi:hypothetical protein